MSGDIRPIYLVIILAIFLVVVLGIILGEDVPEDRGMAVHYVKVMAAERIKETTGIGDTPKAKIIAAEERMIKAAGMEVETAPSTVGATEQPSTVIIEETTIKGVPMPSTILGQTVSRTDMAISLTSDSIWEDYFKERGYMIGQINSDAQLTDKIEDGMGDEVILVAIMDDRLEWEKKFGVEDGRIVLNPEGEPTIWVQVDSKTAEEFLGYIRGNVSRHDTMERMMSYWKADRIKIYPVGKVKEIYDGFKG